MEGKRAGPREGWDVKPAVGVEIGPSEDVSRVVGLGGEELG